MDPLAFPRRNPDDQGSRLRNILFFTERVVTDPQSRVLQDPAGLRRHGGRLYESVRVHQSKHSLSSNGRKPIRFYKWFSLHGQIRDHAVAILKHTRPVGKRVAVIGAGGIRFDVAEFLLLPQPANDAAPAADVDPQAFMGCG